MEVPKLFATSFAPKPYAKSAAKTQPKPKIHGEFVCGVTPIVKSVRY